ncbi:hypothetical protein HDU93_004536 [Gonapodya sp. JEL0774]|nr:hypothetical protein HDU93_004536 [Gonapodya sp. JEL0774]
MLENGVRVVPATSRLGVTSSSSGSAPSGVLVSASDGASGSSPGVAVISAQDAEERCEKHPDQSRLLAHSETRRAAQEAEREVEAVFRERKEELARGVERIDGERVQVGRSVEEVEDGVRTMSRREAVARAEGIVEEVEKVRGSSPVVIDGVVWRLKVYPGGNGQGRGAYVSAFVEMLGVAEVGDGLEQMSSTGEASRPAPEATAGASAGSVGLGGLAGITGSTETTTETAETGIVGLAGPSGTVGLVEVLPAREEAAVVGMAISLATAPDAIEGWETAQDGDGGEYQYRIELLPVIPITVSDLEGATSDTIIPSGPPPSRPPTPPSSTTPGDTTVAAPTSAANTTDTGRGDLPRPPRPPLCREYSSVFAPGECWGYNKFVRFDRLSSDGFLDPRDGSLTFSWGVRRYGWRAKAADVQRYARRLELRLAHLQSRPLRVTRTLSGAVVPTDIVIQGGEGATEAGGPANGAVGSTLQSSMVTGGGGAVLRDRASSEVQVPKPSGAGVGEVGEASGSNGNRGGTSSSADGAVEGAASSSTAAGLTRTSEAVRLSVDPGSSSSTSTATSAPRYEATLRNLSAVFGPNPFSTTYSTTDHDADHSGVDAEREGDDLDVEPTDDLNDSVPVSPDRRGSTPMSPIAPPPPRPTARATRRPESSGAGEAGRDGSLTPTDVPRPDRRADNPTPNRAEPDLSRDDPLLTLSRELGRATRTLERTMEINAGILSTGQVGDEWRDWVEEAMAVDLSARDAFGRSGGSTSSSVAPNPRSRSRSRSVSPVPPVTVAAVNVSTSARTDLQTRYRVADVSRRRRRAMRGQDDPSTFVDEWSLSSSHYLPHEDDAGRNSVFTTAEEDRTPSGGRRWMGGRSREREQTEDRQRRERRLFNRISETEATSLLEVDPFPRWYERTPVRETNSDIFVGTSLGGTEDDLFGSSFRVPPMRSPGFRARTARAARILAEAEAEQQGWDLGLPSNRLFPRPSASLNPRGVIGEERLARNVWMSSDDDLDGWEQGSISGTRPPVIGGRARTGSSGSSSRADSGRVNSRWQQLTQGNRFGYRIRTPSPIRHSQLPRHASLSRLEGARDSNSIVSREVDRLDAVLRTVGPRRPPLSQGVDERRATGGAESDGEIETMRSSIADGTEPGEVVA